MQIDYAFPKQITSSNLNPEVVFRLYGCHIVRSIWRHNSAYLSPPVRLSVVCL